MRAGVGVSKDGLNFKHRASPLKIGFVELCVCGGRGQRVSEGSCSQMARVGGLWLLRKEGC